MSGSRGDGQREGGFGFGPGLALALVRAVLWTWTRRLRRAPMQMWRLSRRVTRATASLQVLVLQTREQAVDEGILTLLLLPLARVPLICRIGRRELGEGEDVGPVFVLHGREQVADEAEVLAHRGPARSRFKEASRGCGGGGHPCPRAHAPQASLDNVRVSASV
ncbi:hypothetical protein B0H16DRAFT_529227 [Mycena metata]|uniref:Uncharacterized protein n=1 Tax=Mycena metata TaxID=1033252 RepID=A0AAD7JGQ7_9AGAR|nr:hypothetical protein B0H16DRAFT_529227 [Mycena metata]